MSAHTRQSSLRLRDIESPLHQNMLSVAQHDNTDIPKRIAEERTGATDVFSLLTERFPLRAHVGSHVAFVVRQPKIQMERHFALFIVGGAAISKLRLVVQE